MRSMVMGLLALGVMLLGADLAQAQRVTPPLAAAGPITPGTVEQTVVGITQVLSLRGPSYGGAPRSADDLLLYNEHTGAAWLVVNVGWLYGQHGTAYHLPTYQMECVVYVPLPPGLRLTASHIDEDGFTDVIGLRVADGKVFRFYRRGWSGC